MRKHKSVVAILLAVMMIFTFMPTMAFAQSGATGTWSDKYTKVKVGDQTYTNIIRTFKDNGTITANIDDYDTEGIYPVISDAVFYDMEGAALNFPAELPKDNFERYFNNSDKKLTNPGIVLTIPSYVSNYNSFPTKTKSVTATAGALGGWTVTVKMPENYEPTATEDQKVTLEAKIEREDRPAATADDPDIINNAVIKKEVLVKASTAAKTGADVKFYLDKESDTALATGETDHEYTVAPIYDGNAHKIIATEAKDVSVAWSVWNSTTAAYDSVSECPSVTNVGDVAKVKAVVSWTTTTTNGDQTITTTHKSNVVFNLSVHEADYYNLIDEVYFNFNKDGDAGNFAYKVAEGTEYNPADFVIPEYDKWSTRRNRPSEWVWNGYSLDSKNHEKAKATVDANNELLKSFFNEFFEVKSSSTAADPNTVTLTIKSNMVEKLDAMKTVAAKNEFKSKYGQMIKNFFGLENPFAKYADHYRLEYLIKIGNGTATVNIIPATPVVNDQEDDISFEGQTKYVYSGKKTTKKGVLKKKQSITVTATADSGNEIKYVATKTAGGKITVSTSGKITVKKGLKSGTYKVTVKAKTTAGNGYKAAKEKQTYVVKIAK